MGDYLVDCGGSFMIIGCLVDCGVFVKLVGGERVEDSAWDYIYIGLWSEVCRRRF